MSTEKDELVRMRKLIVRKHLSAGRKAKSLSARVLATPVAEERDEMLRLVGEMRGLCYALKVLDKTCQTQMLL